LRMTDILSYGSDLKWRLEKSFARLDERLFAKATKWIIGGREGGGQEKRGSKKTFFARGTALFRAVVIRAIISVFLVGLEGLHRGPPAQIHVLLTFLLNLVHNVPPFIYFWDKWKEISIYPYSLYEKAG
jgi:hypothetical protein